VGFIDGNDDAVVGYVAKLAERKSPRSTNARVHARDKRVIIKEVFLNVY
jgi:hypothetical protein